MRASEFTNEVTNATNPPNPGSKDYNASKQTFFDRIDKFIRQYNNGQYNQSKNDPVQYKNIDGNEIYNDFMEKFKAYLQKQGAGFIVPRDFPLVLTQLRNAPTVIQPKTNKPETPPVATSNTEPTSKPTWSQQRAQQFNKIKARSNTATTTTTKIGTESVNEAPILNPSKIAANIANKNQLSWGKGVGDITRLRGGHWEITLNPKTIENMAQALTDRFYANRKLASVDKQKWQELSGAPAQTQTSSGGGYTSATQQLLKRIVGADPQSPEFAQTLSNVVADPTSLEKLKSDLRKTIPPITKK